MSHNQQKKDACQDYFYREVLQFMFVTKEIASKEIKIKCFKAYLSKGY